LNISWKKWRNYTNACIAMPLHQALPLHFVPGNACY